MTLETNNNTNEPSMIRQAMRSWLFWASIAAAVGFGFMFWEFIKRHPGVILVLIGVIGEVVCDWHAVASFREKLGRTFAVLLIIGLVVEIHEATEADAVVAHLESSNLTLRSNVVALEAEADRIKAIATNADLKAESLNPFKQPIRMASAIVNFVTGPVAGKLGKSEDRQYAYPVMLTIGPNGNPKKTTIRLVAYDFKAWGSTNGWICNLECRPDPSDPQILIGPNPDLTVGEFLAELSTCSIDIFFVPPNTDIARGTITLTLNSSVRTVLSIPDAKLDFPRGFTIDWEFTKNSTPPSPAPD